MTLSLKNAPPNFPIQGSVPALPEAGTVQRCRFTGNGVEFAAVIYGIALDTVTLRPVQPLPPEWRSMGSIEFLPANKEQS